MRTTKRAAVLFAAALAWATSVHAAFQQPLLGPEAAAMAGAGMTAYPDSTSLFVNPARLAVMSRPDAYFMYDRMHAGLEGVGAIGQGLMSAGLPTRYGSFAFGLGLFRAAGLMEERTLALTYGRRLTDRLSAGVTAKQLHHSYLIDGDPLAANDPVFRNGNSAAGFAVDLGAAFQATERLGLGLAVRNLNRPDVGLAVEDRVPREIQGSAAYAFPRQHLRFTADLTYRDNDAGGLRDHLTPAIGVEKTLEGGRFAFRGGLTPDTFSAGFGLRVGNLGLDYALVLNRNLVQGSMGTHMIGLRLRFGGSKSPAAMLASLPAAAAPRPVREEPASPGAGDPAPVPSVPPMLEASPAAASTPFIPTFGSGRGGR